MKRWLSCSGLCSRWDINQHDLAEIVNDGKLRSHNQERIEICVADGGYFIEDVEGGPCSWYRKQLTGVDVRKLIFRISHVKEYEKKNGITPHILQERLTENPRVLDTPVELSEKQSKTNAKRAIALVKSEKKESPESEYFRQIGKKGGGKPKKNRPIILAVKQYLREHPALEDKSNEKIARSFERNVKGDNSIIVDFDGCKWDVYFIDHKIKAIVNEKNNRKHSDKSIAYSTFRNTYISEAKKIIKKNA